jgi:hypothetical protein
MFGAVFDSRDSCGVGASQMLSLDAPLARALGFGMALPFKPCSRSSPEGRPRSLYVLSTPCCSRYACRVSSRDVFLGRPIAPEGRTCS